MPADLRVRQGWKPGDELRFVEDDDGTVLLLTAWQAIKGLRGRYAHLVPNGRSIVDEFISDRRVDRV